MPCHKLLQFSYTKKQEIAENIRFITCNKKRFRKGQTIFVGNVPAVVYDFWRTEWWIRVAKNQIFSHKETKKKTTIHIYEIVLWRVFRKEFFRQFPYGQYKIVIAFILKIFILKNYPSMSRTLIIALMCCHIPTYCFQHKHIFQIFKINLNN